MHAAIAAKRPPFVLLAAMNADVTDTMTLVLTRRNMALGALENEQLEVLGGGPRLQETLEAAQKLGTFTAAELAERLAQKLPNLHQRLSQLQDAGVLSSENDPTARRGRRLQFKTAAVELDPARS
jgi:DNA-binding MarR family transcriptional regulator